jgi:hypothetical protein
MTNSDLHLTEEERQRAAERTLAPDQEAAVERHLGQCATCAADVARLTRMIARGRAAMPMQASPQDLWPAIRDRIERAKVIALPEPVVGPEARAARVRRSLTWIGAAAAAAIAIFAIGRASGRLVGGDAGTAQAAATITPVDDSAAVYEEQSRVLFNRLELQRSMLRPQALAAIERDLRVVDAAIAELDAASVRDPNNPVLRRLLASSYREKVGILKRVGNAE